MKRVLQAKSLNLKTVCLIARGTARTAAGATSINPVRLEFGISPSLFRLVNHLTSRNPYLLRTSTMIYDSQFHTRLKMKE